MSEDVSRQLGDFFDSIWHDTQGYVYLPTNHKGVEWTKFMWEWPRQRAAVIKHVIAQTSFGNDVYYAPALFRESRPSKENVLGTWTFWSDFDHGKAPESWSDAAEKVKIPEPTLRIQSSAEGNQHAYWQLSSFITDIEQIESRNRALAYSLGADTGGWDADQVLRPPFTLNQGYGVNGARKDWYEGHAVPVSISHQVPERINGNAFNPLGTPEDIVSKRIELGDIPPLSEVLMAGRWPEDFRTVFNWTVEEASAAPGRSDALQRLGYLGAENGFTDEQLYSVLDDADSRWGKYTNRHNRDKLLLDIIARARVKIGYLSGDDLSFAGLAGTQEVVTDSRLVYSFEEFMDLEVKIDWMLKDLLRNEGVGILTGPPGIGKTQFMIQMGAHMALGKNFLHWHNKTTPKKVLFLSLEMGVVPLKVFWGSVQRSYTDEMRELARNFNVAPLGEGIPLDQVHGQAFLDKLMKEYQPDILLIDSLQKVTTKELTDELAVRAFLEYLDKARLQYHCSMLFVHHNRKRSQDATQDIELSDMYGSNYIAANVDFVLNLRRSANPSQLVVSSLKNRLGPDVQPFEITRDENLYFHLASEAFSGLIHGGSGEPGTKQGGLGLLGLG